MRVLWCFLFWCTAWSWYIFASGSQRYQDQAAVIGQKYEVEHFIIFELVYQHSCLLRILFIILEWFSKFFWVLSNLVRNSLQKYCKNKRSLFWKGEAIFLLAPFKKDSVIWYRSCFSIKNYMNYGTETQNWKQKPLLGGFLSVRGFSDGL